MLILPGGALLSTIWHRIPVNGLLLHRMLPQILMDVLS